MKIELSVFTIQNAIYFCWHLSTPSTSSKTAVFKQQNNKTTQCIAITLYESKSKENKYTINSMNEWRNKLTSEHNFIVHFDLNRLNILDYSVDSIIKTAYIYLLGTAIMIDPRLHYALILRRHIIELRQFELVACNVLLFLDLFCCFIHIQFILSSL